MRFLLINIIAILMAYNLWAQPTTITYQGVLTGNNGAPVNQTQNVKFELYGSENGSDLLWSETHNGVTIEKGIFQVELNSVNNNWATVNFGSQMWLGITVGSTTLTPRIKFNAGGYSLKSGSAINAANLEGGSVGTLPYQSAAGTTTMLAKGAAGQVLTMNSAESAPEWKTPSSGGIVAPTTPQEGSLLYYSAGNWVSKKLTQASVGNNIPINNMQPYLVVNYCIALQGIFPSRNGNDPFVGEISMYAFNFDPFGWAKCDGQTMAIAQNTPLFSLIGTYYGGNGQTTFMLPDLRGRVPIHQGQGPGFTYRSIGDKGGTETTPILIQNLPSHTHTITYGD
jgi:microcystin-dependent protein